jgi:crotonobetainyl-CoA:carnitine CoA-transferase CaiB-like acyl-CoA transferase
MAAHQLKEAILIALLQKASKGNGSHIVVSLYRSAIASLANQGSNWLNLKVVPKPTGSLHPNIAPYGETLTTSEGYKILLAVGSDDQFNRLCKVLSREELILDVRFNSNAQRVINRNELTILLNDASVSFYLNDLLDKLFASNIPCSKIRTIDEVLSDPIAKEMILDQNELDGSISYRLSTIAFDIYN